MQVLAASGVALIVLGCIAAELRAALRAERAVERKVDGVSLLVAVPTGLLPLGGLPFEQLVERDLHSGSTDLYGIGWRGVRAIEGFFVFWFCCFVCFLCFSCLVVFLLPSPFSARRRPRCLMGICSGAIGVIGAAEDRAEDLNIQNKSSMVR